MKNNEKIKKKYIISKILSVMLAIVTIILVIALLKVDILPSKYLVPVISGISLISFLILILQLRKRTNKILRAILNVISVILITVFTLVNCYLQKTYNFLNEITSSTDKVNNYSVIVLNDSKYEKIEDLKDKKMGYIENEEESDKHAKETINEKIKVKLEGNEDLTMLKNMLYESSVDSILIADSYKAILDEEDENFSKKTKTIYTFSIKEKSTEISKDVNVSKEAFNIYISGIDTYGTIGTVSRSDVNMVVTVNPKTHQILLVNIPRDYYVQLHNTKGRKDKLTHAGIYGIEKSVTTVEDLLGIDINYYFKVNFTSLESIVDALDGITVYSKYSFTSYIDNYNFKAGYNNMNGKQALAFARERKSFAEGDRMRGKNQQAVIEAIVRKASSFTVISKYNSILNSVKGKFQTNMDTNEILEIVKAQINSNAKWNITSISLDGSGSSEYTYSAGNQKLYVMIPNQNSVNDAKNKIKEVMEGKVLESSYGEVTNATDPTKSTSSSSSKTNSNTANSKKETKSNDATLASLDIPGLTPSFSSTRTNYTLSVDSDVNKINVSATTNSSKAKVSGTGSVTLKTGKNIVNVVVIAEDGTEKTYTVTITRKDEVNVYKKR